MFNSVFNMSKEDRAKMDEALSRATKKIKELKEAGKEITFDSIMDDASNIFEDVFGKKPSPSWKPNMPDTAPKEPTKIKGYSAKSGKIEVELAGYEQVDVSVKVDGNIVEVTAKNESRGTTVRKYEVPDVISKVVCNMKAGLLTITVKRVEPTATVDWSNQY
jgi:HSP20 family molecular chaperone IbpA